MGDLYQLNLCYRAWSIYRSVSTYQLRVYLCAKARPPQLYGCGGVNGWGREPLWWRLKGFGGPVVYIVIPVEVGGLLEAGLPSSTPVTSLGLQEYLIMLAKLRRPLRSLRPSFR